MSNWYLTIIFNDIDFKNKFCILSIRYFFQNINRKYQCLSLLFHNNIFFFFDVWKVFCDLTFLRRVNRVLQHPKQLWNTIKNKFQQCVLVFMLIKTLSCKLNFGVILKTAGFFFQIISLKLNAIKWLHVVATMKDQWATSPPPCAYLFSSPIFIVFARY